MNTKTNTAKVVPLRRKIEPKTEREAEKKWGAAVMDLGYSQIPSLIFRAQARLGLSAVQLALLLHLVDYWWKKAQMPFPNKATLAERMNLSPRQIQRYLTELETARFITREERFAGHRGQQSNIYHLDGLVRKLKKLEPEFSEVKEQAIEQARKVAKRGGLSVRRVNLVERSKKKTGDEE
ncbi:helix-turn-helix domain-containing protein [Janthinobacterium sp. PSPC3-1]|uniref:helix-turn-helix domain-containing protein n=1 Tax=Janthinobacterium sp. PSPC3-1 TaxID=2804653 RepID=UPI003CED6D8B